MSLEDFLSIKTGLALILLVIVAWMIKSLVRSHHDKNSGIRLDDLLLGDDGRLSKSACVMLGAFALTTWTIVSLVLRDKLTEGYFTAYLGAWVAPTVTRLIFNKEIRSS